MFNQYQFSYYIYLKKTSKIGMHSVSSKRMAQETRMQVGGIKLENKETAKDLSCWDRQTKIRKILKQQETAPRRIGA